ncbi:MAG: UDP-N-acetylglucosamine 1-carboxyvinyltransferase [Clostridia bacterium]|nr:UDP-N-acetylglucosamine 1-carboxyvinyltransferase [Clostridia bacterium]
MERFFIRGGRKLSGSIRVHSAKNAVLPLLAASVLTDDPVVLSDVPDLRDIRAMLEILEHLGCRCTFRDGMAQVRSHTLQNGEMPEKLCKQIRSSIFLLGPLLSRLRTAQVPYPGGCEIGLRPIDLHLKGLRALGVEIEESGGKILCDGRNMHAGDVYLDYPSVGATENVMMASVLLKGVTTIHNAAREPEILDLQRFINRMGGSVKGAGTQVIRIEGVEKLRGITYHPIPDRIVAGTLLSAAAITGGDVLLKGVRHGDMVPVIAKLKDMGCDVRREDKGLSLRVTGKLRAVGEIQTQPHPGFPTDMQSQMVSLCAVAEGCSLVTENVFENRFTHVGDLNAMGANIRISGRTAIIRGVDRLTGGHVTARDLRGGAALVLAALCAKGVSVVDRIEFIDRGYEKMEVMLMTLGADVMRIQ